MSVAIEARPFDLAHFPYLPDDYFQVPGNTEFFVIGYGKAVQIDQGLVVGYGVNPAFAVFPIANAQRHNQSFASNGF